MRVFKALAVLTLVVTTGCAFEATEADNIEELVATQEHEIINGTALTGNSRAVAIYAKGSGTCTPDADDVFKSPYSYSNQWWPRPCSGTLIRKDGNSNYILTARHCVTVNGSINGNLTPGGHLMSTGAVNPGTIPTRQGDGVMVISGEPPAYSVVTYIQAAGSPQNGADIGEDLAYLRANGDLRFTSPPVNKGMALYMGSNPSSMTGFSLTTHSYGRFVPGNCYNHNSSGAGVLRRAGAFTITGASTKVITHTGVNGSSQATTHGDSGGFQALFNPQHGWWWIVGVNSTKTAVAGGQNLVSWLSNTLPVYLANRENFHNTMVVGAEQQVDALVRNNFQEDSVRTRLRYNNSNRQLRFFTGQLCIQDMGNNVNVRVKTCGTANSQKWEFGAGSEGLGQVRNVGSGRCLHKAANTNNLSTTTCSSSVTRWDFFADNDQGS